MELRQPIITVCGHVDHGKTSLLDSVRGTKIQASEAGGITQKISFTTIEKDTLHKRAGMILEKFNVPLNIPGLLFIDTPGHAAFTNLRKRGGSLADIAVVVIDINDGIKPQTAEVLQILKANKTPFIIALNKIDNISGWKTSDSKLSMESVEQQALHVKNVFDERYYTLVGALNNYGINPELYYKIDDFTKHVAVVPTSATTGEGISEVLAMLTALSQKFLSERMSIGTVGKGVVLEVKKDNAIHYLECILYDGVLSQQDEIAIAGFEDTVVTKIRCIEEALPLNKGYRVTKEVKAASGLRVQITAKDEIQSGMPFQVVHNNLVDIKESFAQELHDNIQTDEEGIVVKADSLGSLEALLVLLREKNIPVVKAGIGPISKKDVYVASSLSEEYKMIIGFNVDFFDLDVEKQLHDVSVIKGPVVYQLIDDFLIWEENIIRVIERRKLDELPTICKFSVLDFVFRNSNPAVFGVKVEGGILKKNLNFINRDDIKIGSIKEIQHEKKSVQEAVSGQEVAISMPGVNFERQLAVDDFLFTNLGESQFRKFKEYKDLLSGEEKSILQEIASIKRRENTTWGI